MYLLNHIVYKGFHHQWSLIEVKYKKDQGEDRASAAAAVPVIAFIAAASPPRRHLMLSLPVDEATLYEVLLCLYLYIVLYSSVEEVIIL